jgi:hypothetical protein
MHRIARTIPAILFLIAINLSCHHAVSIAREDTTAHDEPSDEPTGVYPVFEDQADPDGDEIDLDVTDNILGDEGEDVPFSNERADVEEPLDGDTDDDVGVEDASAPEEFDDIIMNEDSDDQYEHYDFNPMGLQMWSDGEFIDGY